MTKSLSLTQEASRGAFWALASNITVSAISFGGTAVLARLLEPKDFGLIGTAALVTGIVQLFGNFGLGAALVQKKDVTQEDLSTAFWADMLAAILLMLVCIAVAPLAGYFFHEKAVQWILICMSLNFILPAVCSIQSLLVYKRLQMKPLAVIEIIGRVLRVAVMLVAAHYGMKYWSILIGIIVERIFKTVAFLVLIPWCPSLSFSREKFKEMFRFGRNLLGGGFVGYLNQNMDFLVTGRVLGVSSLGYYQMAFNLPYLLRGYINDSIGAVSFPVFCKVQDDHHRLARGFLKIVQLISIVTFPILFGLSFTAHDFILVAYSAKWLPAVAPMQVLCFGAALAGVNTALGSLLNAKGRPDLGFKWGGARLPVTVVAILLGVHFAGVLGVALAMLFSELLSLAVVYHAFRILQTDFRKYWRALAPASIASVLMIGVLMLVNHLFLLNASAWVRLAVDFLFGAGVYIVTIITAFNPTFKDLVKFANFRITGTSPLL